MSASSDNNTRSLALRLQALSPARRAAVERLLRERQRGGGAVPPPVPEGLAVTSFGQQRLWFMAQLDPASSVYNTVGTLTLPVPVETWPHCS